MGYFAQQAFDLLEPDLTVEEQLQHDFPSESIGTPESRRRLPVFRRRRRQENPGVVRREKTRLVIARMLLDPPNFLVLDEPTNHLDLFTKEMLIDLAEGLRRDDAVRVARSGIPSALSNRVLELGGESGVERSRICIPGPTSSMCAHRPRSPASTRSACLVVRPWKWEALSYCINATMTVPTQSTGCCRVRKGRVASAGSGLCFLLHGPERRSDRLLRAAGAHENDWIHLQDIAAKKNRRDVGDGRNNEPDEDPCSSPTSAALRRSSGLRRAQPPR